MVDDLEVMIKQMDMVETGRFIFTEYLKFAEKKNVADPLDLWQRHYYSMPSYKFYMQADYFDKMKRKYLLTYCLAVMEITGTKKS